MNIGMILLIVLIVLLFGGFTPHVTSNWGYYPSGGIGLVLLIVLILLLLGKL